MNPLRPGKIVAEVGSVHDGSFGNALKLIELASDVGADVVKFQTHIASAETLRDAPMPPYFKGEPRFEYFERTAFDPEQWRSLKAKAAECGIEFLSSPFSIEAVDLLEEIGVDSYKIPSGEVTNLPLLVRVRATGKPVYLSSGMSDWTELTRAVEALRPGAPVTVMQCTSAYPCPPERYGLNVVAEIRERFGGVVGYSDHSSGTAAPLAAAAVGADVIEKHLTFSRAMYGSDAANALEPGPFAAMVEGLREIWTARAHPVDKDDLAPYREMKAVFEKSIVTARDLAAGSVVSDRDIAYKKPGDGIPAAEYRNVVGRTVKRSIPADTQISREDIE